MNDKTRESRVFRRPWGHPNSWAPIVALVVGTIFTLVGSVLLVGSIQDAQSLNLPQLILYLMVSGLVAGIGIFILVVVVIRTRKMLGYSVRIDKDGITIMEGRNKTLISFDQVERCRHAREWVDGYQYSLSVVHSGGEEAIDVDALGMQFPDIKYFDDLVTLHTGKRSPLEDSMEGASGDSVKSLREYADAMAEEDAFYSSQPDSDETS